MKILLIEDQISKKIAIKAFISEQLREIQHEIIEAIDLNTARREILGSVYDLIIFDIFLPISNEAKAEDVSNDLLNEFIHSKNYQTDSIALTGFEYNDIENIDFFNETGVLVVHYEDTNDNWKISLNNQLTKLIKKRKYDFLIFCALNEERSAYSHTDVELGDARNIKGLNCQPVKINDSMGLCITPSRMGPLHMAITVTKAIEYFQPKIVTMSGICAGIKNSSKMLDVIIGDTCWEYQTGKLKDGGFKSELYQIQLDPELKIELEQFINIPENMSKLKRDLYANQLSSSSVFLAPIVTGSAVVADEKALQDILTQHRKIAGLEMEMISMYEAAFQSLCKPLFFGAKSVVDFGDGDKGDSLHTQGAILSARLVSTFLKEKLKFLVC